MNEQVFKKLFPDEYVDRFLAKNVRVDSRGFDSVRGVMIQKQKILNDDVTQISILISIGGTIIHSNLISRSLKKGVWGMQRSIENPMTISITGDENSDTIETRKNAIVQNMLDIYRKELPSVFDNVNPDEVQFETLSLNLRIHIDLGDKIMGLFLGGLTCLYLLLELRATEMKQEVDHLFPLNFIVINNSHLLADPSIQEERHKRSSEVLVLRSTGGLDEPEARVIKLNGKLISLDKIQAILEKTGLYSEDLKQYSDFIKNPETKILKIFQ